MSWQCCLYCMRALRCHCWNLPVSLATTSSHCPTARGRPWWSGRRTLLWSAEVSWQVSAWTSPSWCDPSCCEASTRTWPTAPASTWRVTASSSSANLSQPRWARSTSSVGIALPHTHNNTPSDLSADRGTGSRNSRQAEGDGQVDRERWDHRGRVQHCKHRSVLPGARRRGRSFKYILRLVYSVMLQLHLNGSGR